VDRERRAAYEKKYWDARRDKRREMVLSSHNKNKERHKSQRQVYLKTDAGLAMYRRQTQKRYALRNAAFVETVSPALLYEEQSGICYLCRGKFEFDQMECDHVIPLAKGGLHQKSNCKMACSTCNRRKGAKLLEELSYPVV
jgi:5-methylcytosine-specific restriction endonuclease McrA